MSRIQVLGLLRFSYPSVYNGRGRDNMEAYRAKLYDPARLARRVLWFEHVVLPCLRLQTDPDFTVALLLGDRLPEPTRSRLEAAVADIPQLVLEYRQEGQHHASTIREIMDRHSDRSADLVAEFQLDDDDAVADEFVARARGDFPCIERAFADSGMASLDYNRGMMMRLGPDGAEVKPATAQFWTPGLLTYRRPDDPTAIRRFSHLELWRYMPCLSLRNPIMFVRGAHEDNASNFANRWDRQTSYRFDTKRIPRFLNRKFGIDLKAMERDAAGLAAAPPAATGQAVDMP